MKASQQIKSNKNPSKLALSTIAPPSLNNNSKKKNKQTKESIKKGLLSANFQSLESSDFPMPKLISPLETSSPLWTVTFIMKCDFYFSCYSADSGLNDKTALCCMSYMVVCSPGRPSLSDRQPTFNLMWFNSILSSGQSVQDSQLNTSELLLLSIRFKRLANVNRGARCNENTIPIARCPERWKRNYVTLRFF